MLFKFSEMRFLVKYQLHLRLRAQNCFFNIIALSEGGANFRVRLNTGFTVCKLFILLASLGNPEAQKCSLKYLSVGGKTRFD